MKAQFKGKIGVPDPRVSTSFMDWYLWAQAQYGKGIEIRVGLTEWAQQAANPAAYAPFVTQPVIMEFARGDQTVPNPTTSAILRAGGLAARATLFRNDFAHADFGTSSNPHTFLTNVSGAGALFAFQAQQQIATFFASDGATTIDPDGSGPLFETPTSMVPEDTGFIP